jgi:acetoin utilization deacetylase AcuC-like enzyme
MTVGTRLPVVGWMDSALFDAHDPGPDHPERNARLVAIRDRFRMRDLDVALDLHEPEPVDRGLLERVHSLRHIERVQQACTQGRRTRLDDDTVVSAGSLGAALMAAGAVVGSVRRVLDGRWDRAFCSVRPPGHHAHEDSSAGFCIFNNVALGCRAALDDRRVSRVAVLDFDAHRGDGTQSLFEQRADVLCVSWHQRLAYPGPTTVRGTGIDCALPLRATQAVYLEAWRDRVLPALERFEPHFVLVSAGFDADRRDPYAELAMDPRGFYELTWQIVQFANARCQGRVVSVLEGGYDLDALADGAAAHVEALLELPLR